MRLAKAYVEITNICNRNCSFCPKTQRAPGQMSPEAFGLIGQKLRPYCRFIYLHLMGEPLLHSQLEEILSICQKLDFWVIITTNGTLLAQRRQLLLAASALHKVNISLHGFEANKERRVRQAVAEISSFVRQAAQKGILCCFRLWNLDGDDGPGENRENPEILAQLHQEFPGAWQENSWGYRLQNKVFLAWGRRFSWPSLSERENEDRHFCYGLVDQIGVLWDGTVVPCCLDHEGDIPLGNLFRQSMEDILASPRAQAILDGFVHKRAVEPLCRRCGYALRFQ